MCTEQCGSHGCTVCLASEFFSIFFKQDYFLLPRPLELYKYVPLQWFKIAVAIAIVVNLEKNNTMGEHIRFRGHCNVNFFT